MRRRTGVRSNVVPLARPRRAPRKPRGRRPWLRTRRRTLGQALVWAGLFVGATLLAPVVDDARSRLRAMETDCRVIRVVDGDTVELACPGRAAERARIVGYDAPELSSPGCVAELAAAEAARGGLSAMVVGPVEVAFLGRDTYDRALVDMRAGGERVAARMVAEGHGRRYLGGLRGGWCG